MAQKEPVHMKKKAETLQQAKSKQRKKYAISLFKTLHLDIIHENNTGLPFFSVRSHLYIIQQ